MKKIIILFYLLLLVQLHANFKPTVQLGKDIVIKKNLTKTIKVNGAYTIEAGVEYFHSENTHYSTQFLFGYKNDSLERIRKKNKNIPIIVTRKTLSLVEKYHQNNYHVGIGLAYHLVPHADYTFKKAITREFNNAFGLLMQIGYSVTQNIDLNLKTTFIKYTIEVKRKNKIYTRKYNTSSMGIFLSYTF